MRQQGVLHSYLILWENLSCYFNSFFLSMEMFLIYSIFTSSASLSVCGFFVLSLWVRASPKKWFEWFSSVWNPLQVLMSLTLALHLPIKE